VAVLSHTLAVRTSSTLTDSARDHRGDSMAKVGEIWDDGTLIMLVSCQGSRNFPTVDHRNSPLRRHRMGG
jgi:hypothetical protein